MALSQQKGKTLLFSETTNVWLILHRLFFFSNLLVVVVTAAYVAILQWRSMAAGRKTRIIIIIHESDGFADTSARSAADGNNTDYSYSRTCAAATVGVTTPLWRLSEIEDRWVW